MQFVCFEARFISPDFQKQTRMSDMGEEESREYDGTAKETKDDEEGRSDSDEEDRMQSFFSEEANKVVRDKYQELMTVLHQHTDEERNMDTHSLQLLVLEANEAFDSVKRPREAAIDAQLLKLCGNMAKFNIETSHSSLKVFKPREFAEKLICFGTAKDDPDDDEEINLISKIGRKSSSLFHSVPGMEPFFSAVEWEKPEPVRRAKQKRNPEVATTEAKKVAVLKDREGEEEAEAVSWMCKILKQCYAAAGNNPLPFFNFVIDPSSFSRSVENLFHVSLLVREQYAEITEDEESLPVILPTQSIEPGEQGYDKQCVFSMDMGEWRDLIKAFQIKRAMIPPKEATS